MKNALIVTILLFIFGNGLVSAQDSTKSPQPGQAIVADSLRKAKPVQSQVKQAMDVRDSLKAKRRRPGILLEKEKPERRKFDSSLFTDNTIITRSDYLESMEKIFQMLNQVPAITSSFIHLPEIDDHLDEEDSALDILQDRVVQNDRTLNIRNLQMFNTLLDALDKNTESYSRYLEKYDNRMDSIKKDIRGMRKDTLILRIFRDSTLKASFAPQLSQLKDKWRLVDSLVKTYTEQINEQKARASANAIVIKDLIYRVDNMLKTVGSKAFGKERRYLWEPRTNPGTRFNRDAFRKSVASEKTLVHYYFANTRSKRMWILLTGIIFFYWVWFNFRSLKKMDSLQAIEEFHFVHIKPRPWAASLIFILSLAPLFDLHAPAVYIESIQFLLMVVLTFMFRRQLPRKMFYGWCIFILLFLLQPITRILGLPISLQRWANLVQDGLSVAFGIFFLFNSAKMPGKTKIISFAAGLYVFFNLLAVVCNLFGRVSLSQIFGATGVYVFAQTMSLIVFVQLVVESFLLQIQTSRVRKKYPKHFESAVIARSINKFMSTLAVFLWLVVFTTNLNIFDSINDFLVTLFTTKNEVGSFEFTFSEIILFLGIIWIANFLQKYIAYFFGDTGDDAAIDDKGQRSRLLVTRLILLSAGFLLAVAASGLPIDKITVILGALGVGIGLGLQSIVNNFVSGIILIFDRPLRIGDTVEVGGNKGRVKEIGIRSSTLLTEDGAEVIIPNGDVLSHNIVNWTLSNNHIRMALAFTVDRPASRELIDTQAIRALVQENQNVLERRDPEVSLINVNSKTVELRVYFWCKDIGKASATAGEVRTAIYHLLEEKGVTVV